MYKSRLYKKSVNLAVFTILRRVSCRCETYPIVFISFLKVLCCEAIQYKNRAELFVVNRSKSPIRYKFHNSVKPKAYNENMVLISS